MAWQIEWSDHADRQLGKINSRDAGRIYNNVVNMVDDPWRVITRLIDTSLYKMRVGDYRVILKVEEKIPVIWVVAVEHRSKVYKRLHG